MATILQFPSTKFRDADRAELLRWSLAAHAVARWYAQCDPDDGLVSRTEDGDEYAVLANEGSEATGGSFIVQPCRGCWQLTDPDGAVLATFGTLREALESVCKTIG
jgi:hypothetical protein